MKIKYIISRTDYSDDHSKKVNEFISLNTVDVVSIENLVHGGNSFSKYTRAEIVTIITYNGGME